MKYIYDLLKSLKNTETTVKDLAIVSACLGLFSVAATISPITDKRNITAVLIWDCIFVLPMIVFGGLRIKLGIAAFHTRKLRDRLRENRWLLFLLLSVLGLRLVQMGTFPKWDSETYFMSLMDGCKSFSFSLLSYVKGFRLAGHTSLGFALPIAIGCFLTPNRIIGVQIVNLMLVLLWTAAVFKILKKLFPSETDMVLCICTLLVSMEPMFLGLFSGVSLDFGMCLFFGFLLYAHLYDRRLLFQFCALMLAQTKETGIIILAGYGFGCVVGHIFKTDRTLTSKKRALISDPFLRMLLLTAFLMAIYFAGAILYSSSGIWGNKIKVQDIGKGVNYFAVNLSFVLLKLKTICLLNFSWLLLCLDFTLLIYGVFHRKRAKLADIRERDEFVPAVGFLAGLAALTAFNCLYITYNNPRYVLPVSIGLNLLTGVMLVNIIRRRKVLLSILLLLCFIDGCEAYVTIDPVTLHSFSSINTENRFGMVHTGWEKKKSLIADIATYNYQISFLDKAFDQMLAEVNYDGTTLIITGGEPRVVRAGFWGGMKTEVYWNTKTKHRTFIHDKDAVQINSALAKFEEQDKKHLPDEAILVWVPIFVPDEKDALECIRDCYQIMSKHKVSIGGSGSIYYYMISKEK